MKKYLMHVVAVVMVVCISSPALAASAKSKHARSSQLGQEAQQYYGQMSKEQVDLFKPCADNKKRACSKYYSKYIKN